MTGTCMSIDFSHLEKSNENMSSYDKLSKSCNEAIVIANEKANNLEPWENSPSSYLINKFLAEYEDDRKIILNFQTQQKTYNCDTLISENIIEHISNDFLKNRNKKNAYSYSSPLAKQLLGIIFDYLNYVINDEPEEIVLLSQQHLKLEGEKVAARTWYKLPTTYASQFKNFERDLLISEYSEKKDDVDNKGTRGLIYSSSQLFYAASNNYFFIMTYSPANEQYYNQQIQEVYKAPNFSFLVYDREVEDYLVENFEIINTLHRNFMQFTYLADTNQNIVNAMGEASLISQYWYTESVNRILKDHEKELSKSKDSALLAEYIIRYILAAEIKGVELIEVYPFDRVFMFNNSVFSEVKERDTLTVFEGLLESKVPHKDIKDKEFLGGKTQFAYEWEREQTKFSLDRFDPSKKKIKKTNSNAESLKLESGVWVQDYNKDNETIINNLIFSMFADKKDRKDTNLLEYKSNYMDEGITYLYSSGINLSTQIKALYALQEHHLTNFVEDDNNAIKKESGQNLFEDETYFDNVKVVLFSYTPDDDKSEKGFTLILIANDDVPKALMEQKAEKDDLYTALKLLINQHFTIDQKYKEKSIKEQNELIDILTQTKHSIKNSFDTFQKDGDLQHLKEKILDIIEQDKQQMQEHGRDATVLEIEQSGCNASSLENSYTFLHSLFSTTIGSGENKKIELNRKFDKLSKNPWDYFAREIFNLKLEDLKKNRIYKTTWKGKKNEELNLIIDFNELQNFSFEWKESLFNDAIYVMLKNACEHSMETYEKKDRQRDIFLDIYISNLNGQETLNIEFTNCTRKICKEMFTHINKETTIKGNSQKENSTGIGVVTIRKRLDVTYGLELSDIKFTMVNESTIKALLYFPIKSKINDSVFVDEQECNKNAKILYLEDSEEYYKENKKFLNSLNLTYLHDVRYDNKRKNKGYSLLISDLNIFGPNDNVAASSHGKEAILDFFGDNKDGVTIILSSDVEYLEKDEYLSSDQSIIELVESLDKDIDIVLFSDVKEISLKIENNLIIKKDLYIDILKPKTLYLLKDKHLPEGFLEAIKLYEKESKVVVNSSSKKMSTIAQEEKDNNTVFEIRDFTLLKSENSLDDINKKAFRTDIAHAKEAISQWLTMSVKTIKRNRSDFLTNCEVSYMFETKLLVPCKKEDFQNFVLRHETLRRNIVLIKEDEILDDNRVLEQINEVQNINIQKNGVFGKISHDILNKMPVFSFYTQEKINTLKDLNNRVRKEFNTLFTLYLANNESDILIKNIEKDFLELKKELNVLESEAHKKHIHLGTDIANIHSILRTMDYICKEGL